MGRGIEGQIAVVMLTKGNSGAVSELNTTVYRNLCLNDVKSPQKSIGTIGEC